MYITGPIPVGYVFSPMRLLALHIAMWEIDESSCLSVLL